MLAIVLAHLPWWKLYLLQTDFQPATCCNATQPIDVISNQAKAAIRSPLRCERQQKSKPEKRAVRMAKADTFSTFSETDEMDEMERQTVGLAW